MRRRIFAGVLVLLAVLFTGLAVWQFERRAWKLALIEQVNTRVHAAPRPIAGWSDLGTDAAYTRVQVTGVLRHDQETLVQAVTDHGPGWWVLTPLVTPAGTVLINRGFTPPQRRSAATRGAGAPTGPVTITGLVRASEPGGGFLRRNDPAGGRWYSRDVAAIAKAQRLTGAAPFFIDADATPNPGGYPIGGLTVVAFRNTHLVYMLTWLALAGMSLFGLVLLLRPKEPR